MFIVQSEETIQAHHISKTKCDPTMVMREHGRRPKLPYMVFFQNISHGDFSWTQNDLTNPSSKIVNGGEKKNISKTQPDLKMDARNKTIGLYCLI